MVQPNALTLCSQSSHTFENVVKGSVNCSRSQLIELNAIELKSITCGKPTYACPSIGIARTAKYDLDIFNYVKVKNNLGAWLMSHCPSCLVTQLGHILE